MAKQTKQSDTKEINLDRLESLLEDVGSVSEKAMKMNTHWVTVTRYLRVLLLSLRATTRNDDDEDFISIVYMTEQLLAVLKNAGSDVLHPLIAEQSALSVKLNGYLGKDELGKDKPLH